MHWRTLRRRKETHQVFVSALQDAADEPLIVNCDDLPRSEVVQVSQRTCLVLPETCTQTTKNLRSVGAVLRGQSQIKSEKQHWSLLTDLR